MRSCEDYCTICLYFFFKSLVQFGFSGPHKTVMVRHNDYVDFFKDLGTLAPVSSVLDATTALLMFFLFAYSLAHSRSASMFCLPESLKYSVSPGFNLFSPFLRTWV